MIKNIIILSLSAVILFNLPAKSQKVLSQSETNWVNEAKTELQRALSDPDMDEAERISIIQKSARTLKEYGQEPAFPSGKIPLAEMMDENYEMCKKNIIELNDWYLKLERSNLTEKLRFINAIQIEMLEEEIGLLIPGKAVVQLTQEAIGKIFGWNIVEGVNQGEVDDANQLVELFKKMAKAGKLAGQVGELIKDEKRSMNLINEDRKKLKYTEAVLRQKYKYAEASTRTMKGYEGAIPANATTTTTTTKGSSSETKTSSGTVSKTVTNKSNVLVGTWRFGFAQTGYFLWTFNNDGSFVFKDNMNGGDERRGKYSVSGNILSLYNSEGCEKILGKYSFRIIDDELHFSNIDDKCVERRLTLNHIWKK